MKNFSVLVTFGIGVYFCIEFINQTSIDNEIIYC